MKQKVLRAVKSMGLPVFSIIVALSIGALFMLVLDYNVGKAYSSLLSGIFGSVNSISESLIQATPLIFTAISYAVAFRSGLINLGGEGQLYMGAVFGSIVGSRFQGLPTFIHLALILLCGFIGGALWGFIAGALKVKFGASELITTIMLNYIALEFVSYCVTNVPFKDTTPGAAPRMPSILENLKLPILLPRTRLHVGILLALAAMLIYYLFMWKTTKGYELRVMGQNPDAGRYSGFKVKSNAVFAFSLAGGFAGLGGVVNIIGLQYFLTEGFASGFGFSGVAVALLGSCHPAGMLISAFLFGSLNAGGIRMQTVAQVPSAMMSMIQGLIILFAVSPYLFPWLRTQFMRIPAFSGRKKSKSAATTTGGEE